MNVLDIAGFYLRHPHVSLLVAAKISFQRFHFGPPTGLPAVPIQAEQHAKKTARSW